MENSENLKKLVREKYGEIAKVGQSACGCGCGCGSEQVIPESYSVFSFDYSGQQGYNKDADLGLGCGIPTDVADIQPGQTVVDLGSGAGNDCFVARHLVGEAGEVIGVDMTREMVERAKANALKLGFTNVKFRLGDIEDLPITANKADVVISNCVLNLVPDKYAAFNEIIRVLKPGGHFSISDVVLEGKIPENLKEQAEFYAGCISGAVSLKEYLHIIEETGFINVAVRKRKKVELPDRLVQDLLSPADYKSYQEAEMGIYSVTVYGLKPSCCCGE